MESPYSHPPYPPPRLRVLILDSTRVKRHIHSCHEGLASSILHLLDVASLGILVHAENIQGDDALELNWHALVKRTAEGVVMILTQRA